MDGSSFYIIERNVRGKKSLYMQYTKEDGKLSSLFSVNKIASQLTGRKENVKKKKDAIRVVHSAIERGVINFNRSGKTAEEYIRSYWDYDGERIKRKNKLNPGSVGKAHSKTSLSYNVNHIFSILPKSLLIKDVDNKLVRKVFNKIADKDLANATISKIMMAFTTPLRQAYKEGLILRDPTLNLDTIRINGELKGILTQSEFKATLEDLQQNCIDHVILAVVLSAVTGMRMGEIRGLQIGDIEIINNQDSIINVNHAWSEYDGLKIPKGKKSRKTVCPTKLAKSLIELGEKNPTKNSGFVFWSLNGAGATPISSNHIRDEYYKSLVNALEKLNDCVGELVEFGKDKYIKKGEIIRMDRNITFHSLRHFFITRAQTIMGGDAETLRLTVGHESQEMTDRYTHADYDSLKKIAEASRTIYEE